MADPVVGLTYNGYDLTNVVSVWSEELSAARERRRLAMQRGEYLPSTLEGPRLVHVRAKLFGEGASPVEHARAQREALDAALSVDEPKLLTLWSGRQIYAVRENADYKPIDNMEMAWQVDLDFLCPNPLWEATEIVYRPVQEGVNTVLNQQFTWANPYYGTAPCEPMLRFVIDHASNSVDEFVYYGPNMLTNTQFHQGEHATDDGVPLHWEGLNYGVAGTYYSFTEPEAEIILNLDSPSAREAALYQDIPLTEVDTVVSGRAEVHLPRWAAAGSGRTWIRIQFLNAAMAVLATHNGAVLTTPDWPPGAGPWQTIEMENVTAPVNTAWVRFHVMAGTLEPNQFITVLVRNAALVRTEGAGGASFPGHFDNKTLSITRPAGNWITGEIFEVDNAAKTVRYFAGDDWEEGWSYFLDSDFFQLDPSFGDNWIPEVGDPELHFSWIIDHKMTRLLEYRQKYWNA